MWVVLPKISFDPVSFGSQLEVVQGPLTGADEWQCDALSGTLGTTDEFKCHHRYDGGVEGKVYLQCDLAASGQGHERFRLS